MSLMRWNPALLSIIVTGAAAVLILILGLALAVPLARRRFPGRTAVETLIALPLVLPPSVVGYYLLRFLGRGGPVADWLGLRLLFTPAAAMVAATVVGLPLMVQAAQAALAGVDPALENAARTLGSGEAELFFRVTLPLARRGILAGWVLGAARALGEFGATLMVAGNIPGRTQTLPLAIYDAVQNRRFDQATRLVLIVTAIAFLALYLIRRLERPAGPGPRREARAGRPAQGGDAGPAGDRPA
jgi:molybdate transport system permease protein